MNDREFRLDFFIAIAALLISALTAATLLYQTRVIGDQFAATIWPYLSLGTTYNTNGETIEVTNDGLGPALVRSAQLGVDGTAVHAWNDYIAVLAQDPQLKPIFLRTQAAALAGHATLGTLTMSSIGPSTTLRPGESHTLLRIALNARVPALALTKHAVTIDLCYCSLNGSCWMLHAEPGRITPDPRSVSRCGTSTAIESNVLRTPAQIVPPQIRR